MNIVSYNEELQYIVSDCGKGDDNGRLCIFSTLNFGLMLVNFQPFELTEIKPDHKYSLNSLFKN